MPEQMATYFKYNSSPLSVTSRIFLSLLTSVFITISFPLPDQGWLAWIALVPLIVAISRSSRKMSFLLGLLSGVCIAWGIFYWLFQVPGFRIYHGIILSLYFGSYFGIWALGTRILQRRLSAVTFAFSSSSLWVLLEYVRGHAGFLSLPWATLAQTQYENILILQTASFTGEYGISFLVILFNLSVSDFLTTKKIKVIVAASSIIFILHVWGWTMLESSPRGGRLSIGLIQPNIQVSERETEKGTRNTLRRLEEMTLQASQRRPSLIVWPETSIKASPYEMKGLNTAQNIVEKTGLPILAGVSVTEKFGNTGTSGYQIKRRFHNSAFLLEPGKEISAPYNKMILVPFGEYLPWKDKLKWPEWIIQEPFNIEAGESYKIFSVSDSVRIGPIICWENLFASHVRGLVNKGANIVIQLTNDYWFGNTAAPYQHNLASVIRAVENRIPVVIASNTGPSWAVGPYGRIIKGINETFFPEILDAKINMSEKRSFYADYGDVFIKGLILINITFASITTASSFLKLKHTPLKKIICNISVPQKRN